MQLTTIKIEKFTSHLIIQGARAVPISYASTVAERKDGQDRNPALEKHKGAPQILLNR